jgi:hypothetical protein
MKDIDAIETAVRAAETRQAFMQKRKGRFKGV